MSLKTDFQKQKNKCIKCDTKDPCVTVYHGTSVNSVSSIRRDGMKDQYATTSVYRAVWFGRDFGRPILAKIRTPLSKLRWTDPENETERKVHLSDLAHEERIRDALEEDLNKDMYLFIKGKIKPCQIVFLPRKELVKRFAKTPSKYKYITEDTL